MPAGAMLRVLEIPDFPAFKDRDFFKSFKHPYIEDTFLLENAPSRMTALPDPVLCPAPLMGEHSLDVVRDLLGLSEDELKALTEDGILEVAEPVS